MKLGVILAVGLFIFLGTAVYVDKQSVPDLIDRQKSITEDEDFLNKIRLFREGIGEDGESDLEKTYLNRYEYPESTTPYITTPKAQPMPIPVPQSMPTPTPYTINTPTPQPTPQPTQSSHPTRGRK